MKCFAVLIKSQASVGCGGEHVIFAHHGGAQPACLLGGAPFFSLLHPTPSPCNCRVLLSQELFLLLLRVK